MPQTQGFDVIAALPETIQHVIGEAVHHGTAIRGEALLQIIEHVANATATHHYAAGRAAAMAERLRVKDIERDEATGLITRVVEHDA